MADTANLAITLLTTGQVGKEASINAGFTRLDESNNDTVDVDVSAGGTITLTSAQKLDNMLIRLTGSPAGAFTVDIPDGNRSLAFQNVSGQTATIDTVTGTTTISLSDTETAFIFVRGTALTLVGEKGTGSGVTTFGKKSEYIPAAAMQPAVTNGCSALTAVEGTAGNPNVHVRDFDPTTAEAAQFQFVFPNRWNKSTITFQAYYTHAGGQTAGLDGVAWGLSAVSIVDDAVWDVAFGTQVVVTLDRANSGDVHVTAESGVVTVGGTLNDAQMTFFELERVVGNAADDLNIDARLLGVRIFWTEDGVNED